MRTPARARAMDCPSGSSGEARLRFGIPHSDDPVIWERARNEQAVIISKDEDFVDHWLLSAAPVQLVWIRKGNCSNRALLVWLEPLWLDTVKRLQQGEKFIELRA